MSVVVLIVSTLAALITIFEWTRRTLNNRKTRFLYAFILVVLTVVTTFQVVHIDRLTSPGKQARSLLDKWPTDDYLTQYTSRGEMVGLILGGLRFFEENQSSFPETYAQAKRMGIKRLKGFEDYSTWSSSSNDMELYKQLCLAMKRLLQSVAE
jgi:hypothetical protein